VFFLTWFNAKSTQELKLIGKISLLKKDIENSLGDKIRVTARSWEDLYNTVKSLRNFVQSNLPEETQKSNNSLSYISYFKSEQDELIFYLLELDGEVQLEKLKITKFHYNNKEYAKTWRNKLIHKLHPDVCKHPKALEATAEINRIYERMTASHERKRQADSTI
jgi:hypothetical protein